MSDIGKQVAIFLNINSKEYTVGEKGAAILAVCDMPTHNSIKKDQMISVIRWLVELLFICDVKSESTNGDRIRSMSDEELAIFLSEWALKPWAWKRDTGETEYWLQQPAEEAVHEQA